MLLRNLINKFRKVNSEVEGEEKLEHDIVLAQVDGKLVEVTPNGFKEKQQE